MAVDDLIVRNTREWLARARDDLELAENAVRGGTGPFMRDAAFHCQQAAEKALKAFLTWRDLPFPRVHDLEDRRGGLILKDFLALFRNFSCWESPG